MNAYEAVTARLIEHLERGVIPWRQPWRNTSRGAYLPTNFVTGRGYRGINLAMLLCSGFTSQEWMTYKQAAETGVVSNDLDAHNAAYLKSWLDTFKSESRIAVFAAQRAQKAADFILGRAAAEPAAVTVEAEAVAA